MCLYNFSPCRAHTPQGLLTDLTDPSPELILVRCKWYQAMAEAWQTDGGVKFHIDKDICPYVVIRHEDTNLQESEEMMAQAVLLDGLSHGDRGCPECWDIVSSRQWMGRMPTMGEKLEYLYTSSTSQVGGGGADGEMNGGFAGLEGEADGAGESSGIKRRREEEKDAAVEQMHDAEDDEIEIVAVRRVVKKPKCGGTKSNNNRDRRDTAIFSSSAFAEPLNRKSSFANWTATTTLVPAVGEVIPPRPDQINHSESETYSISPTGDGRNWNPSTDKLFSKVCQKSSGGWNRSAPAQEPLQASRRQTKFEFERNLNPRSARADTVADDIVTGTRASAEEGATKLSESTDPLDSHTAKGRMNPVAARPAECVQCGHTFTVTCLNTTNSDDGLLCVECSKKHEDDERELRPHKKSHKAHSSTSADPVGEGAEDESTDINLGDEYESERDSDGDAPDDVSSNDMSDLDASNRTTPDWSPGRYTDAGASESEPWRDEVTKLRSENARLRVQVADLLDLNADASRREARLLRKLNRYEGGEEDKCEAKGDAEVKASEEPKPKPKPKS